MNILKKSIIVIFLIYIFSIVFGFLTSPHIKTINHTNIPIRFNSLQYVDTDGELTDEAVDDWRLTYHIKKSDSKTMKIYRKYRFSKENIYFGIDYSYDGDYFTEDNRNDLTGVNFTEEQASPEQSAYCAFKVEVYPNRKTIVTPTREWGCIRPMYYHKPSLEDEE